ncbi:MAG: pilus assembly protein TadG-related protein, partial [Devosia sp.]
MREPPAMRPFLNLLKRFRRDENGAFMVLFAVLAIVLIATSGAVVDFTSMQTARSRAQTSLDSAALALQSRISIDNIATLKSKAQSIVTQSINDSSITATITDATVDTTAGKLNLVAQIVTNTAFVQLVGIRTITAHLQSEVTRGSVNLEVSVALDITGSMLGQKLTDLKTATNTLIDLVVQDAQTPTYSKMSIIPWSNAVNVGSGYAAAIRGAVTGPTTISSATWIAAAAVNIGGASPAVTKANPAVVNTSTNHGLVAGDYIYITGVVGMTNLNGNIYKVGTVNTTVTAVNTAADTLTTASPHLLANGNIVQLSTTGATPGGLSAGVSYYVVSATLSD